MTEEEDSRFSFLEAKVKRVSDAVSGIYGALTTGATWQRINGAVLVPGSVGTTIIEDLAITETKIDSDAVSTPKLQANAITANKLEARLVLSTEVVAGIFADPNYQGVLLDSTGLRLFNGAGVQRGLMSTDGSGWLGDNAAFAWDTAGAVAATGIVLRTAASGARVFFDNTGITMRNSGDITVIDLTPANGLRFFNPTGSVQRLQLAMDGSGWLGTSTALAWTAAGVVTATGITVKSAATTARAELNSAGLKFYNSGGTVTGQLLADGSGFLGGSSKISWDTAGSVTIDGANTAVNNLDASNITTGTINAGTINVTNLNASNLSNGNIGSGGTGMGLGGTNGLTVNGTLTIGTGGSIVDADGSYWDQTGIHLVSAGGAGDAIEWITGAVQKGYITSDATLFSVGSASVNVNVGKVSGGYFSATSSIARIGVDATGTATVDGGGFKTSGAIFPANQSTRSFSDDGANLTSSASFKATGNLIATSGVYPGDQTTRGLTDSGTKLGIAGPINITGATVGGSAANWSSFTTTNIPDKSAGYIVVDIGGVASRIPFYADG